jgi:hypothetical protein
MRVLKLGERLKSAVCDTQVMVIRTSGAEHDLRCGGLEMIDPGARVTSGKLDPAHAGVSLMGKRYVNAEDTVEVLCTKGGKGSLWLDGASLAVKQAKPLPASD